MENAQKAYGMHDAIQISVNADADRAMHVEYDSFFPFEYWNAGASWCLLPIYEYWQCYGNIQIPINDYMRIENLQPILSVCDGGLTDREFADLKARGYLDLEKDILLPLLTKQANFWEQIVTPRYYTDKNGNACHDESKTALEEGEKYIILPAYSPENNPIGYLSTLTANATMDISAARDGLDMLCQVEQAVGRAGHEKAVERWQQLKNQISDYIYDKDGALREWAMSEYLENNNHRHLSHLYVAWPAYETQKNPALAKAANIALNNRNEYNTDDATAGHGWIHKAFVFSNTSEIEILPALPSKWQSGEVTGLMSRSRAEITKLTWDSGQHTALVTLTSNKKQNQIQLRCGQPWSSAVTDGRKLPVFTDEAGSYVKLNLEEQESTTVQFILL